MKPNLPKSAIVLNILAGGEGIDWLDLVEGGATLLWGLIVGVGNLVFNGDTETLEVTPQASTVPFLIVPGTNQILSVNTPPFPIPEESKISLEVFPGGVNFEEVLDNSLFIFPDDWEL